jgi:AcrR family transcriptional regulator
MKIGEERGRATRADWLSTALEAIHRAGPSGLNIQKLARQLKISKTSFYWHFKDRQDLRNTLLEFWVHEFTEVITKNRKLIDSPPDKRLAMTMDIVEKYDLAYYDLSFRVWAKTDPSVKEAVHKADELRLDFVRNAFSELGFRKYDLENRATLFLSYISSENIIFSNFSQTKRKKLRNARLELLLKGSLNPPQS